MKWRYPFLFAILTFWLSEATFRPPITNYLGNYKDDYWHGWKGVIKGYSIGIKRAGPAYHIAKIPYQLFGVHEISPKRRVSKNNSRRIPADRERPVDIIAFLIWIFICYGGAIIVGVNRRLNKRTAEATGIPLHTRSHRKPIIALVIVMGLGIIVAEIRNAMCASFRETNKALSKAVMRGDVVAVKEYLDDGAEVNVMVREKSTLLDRAYDSEIIKLLRNNGAKTGKELEAE